MTLAQRAKHIPMGEIEEEDSDDEEKNLKVNGDKLQQLVIQKL